jgi:hypothetical protein
VPPQVAAVTSTQARPPDVNRPKSEVANLVPSEEPQIRSRKVGNAQRAVAAVAMSKGTQEELILLRELEELDRKAHQKIQAMQAIKDDDCQAANHVDGGLRAGGLNFKAAVRDRNSSAIVSAGAPVLKEAPVNREKLAFKAGAKDLKQQINVLSKEEKVREKQRLAEWQAAQETERKAEEARLVAEQMVYQQQVAIERQRREAEEAAAMLANKYKSSYLGNFHKKGQGEDKKVNYRRAGDGYADDGHSVMSSITNASVGIVSEGARNRQQLKGVHKNKGVQETVSLPPLLPAVAHRQTVSQGGTGGKLVVPGQFEYDLEVSSDGRGGSTGCANEASRTKTMSAPSRFVAGGGVTNETSSIGDMSPVRKSKISGGIKLPPPVRVSHDGYGINPDIGKKKLLQKR